MTVSDQIIQVLNALCEKFGLMIDWTSENVIPYMTTLCTKLVSYEIWTSVAWIVMALIGIIGIVAIITRPSVKESTSDLDVGWVLFTTFSAIFGLACIGCIIDQTMDIIQCVTFPEMYIFEYIQGVINGGV